MSITKYDTVVIYDISFWSTFRLVAISSVCFLLPCIVIVYLISFFGSRSLIGNSSIIDTVFYSSILALLLAASLGVSSAIGMSLYLKVKPLRLYAKISTNT
jgi:hypothetical protein